MHVMVTALVAVIVLIEEISQIYLPQRSFDVLDLLADLAGIVIFSVFAYFRMKARLDA